MHEQYAELEKLSTSMVAGRDVRSRVLWMADRTESDDAPPLVGETRARVAIIGGGYVGLWTALHIMALEPGADVVLLEQGICGSGASGRNGGFVLSWWPKIMTLVERCGSEEAVRLAVASEASIDAIEAFCRAHDIDADVVRRGWMWTATNATQVGAWDGVLETCARLGASPFTRLEPAAVAARSGSAIHRAGVIEASNGTVQPAALVRGLRRVAIARGVRIHEQTCVRSFTRDRPSEIRTSTTLATGVAHGVVRADTVVLATGAWAASVRELARTMVVVSSDIVATAPIPERLAGVGWTDGVAITDAQLRVHYYRTTRDGRIVFGKGGGTVAYGARLGASFEYDARRAAETAADFRRTYPALADVRLTHAWSGAVDRTPSALPAIGHLGGRPHLLHGVGWSGHGVGPSHLGGRILASLALDHRDEWSTAGIVDLDVGRFPPEPIRYLGGRVVQAAVTRSERAAEAGRGPARVDGWLASLAPNE